MEGRAEGRTDPILEEPSGYHRGSNKWSKKNLEAKIRNIVHDFQKNDIREKIVKTV